MRLEDLKITLATRITIGISIISEAIMIFSPNDWGSFMKSNNEETIIIGKELISIRVMVKLRSELMISSMFLI